MKKYKNKIIIGFIVILILAFAYWWGGNSPQLHGWRSQDESTSPIDVKVMERVTELSSEVFTESETLSADTEKIIENTTEEIKHSSTEATSIIVSEKLKNTDKSNAESDEKAEVEENKSKGTSKKEPLPIEPENAVISDKQLSCTLSVRCDTVLEKMEALDKEKIELVPKNGVIYAEQNVVFYEGESVFNVLLREMKKNKIHLEFENTPIYNSAYIEGIGNLYEFDCGELSGWMYKVNGVFPSYGCSRYQLKAGDKIEWVYTCDLGSDVGGSNSARNGFEKNE